MFKIRDFINDVKNENRIIIQTHNFPDHDAVAAAYGLSMLLLEYGIDCQIIYKGDIQRNSLIRMINNLNINICKYEDIDLKEQDKIIIVDGCKGNSNVEELCGEEIAVIDHHEVDTPDNVRYSDIRSRVGACSTIIFSYYKELNLKIQQDVATALIIGLNMDTANLTRGVSEEDVIAFYSLYLKADISLVNSILRNYIKIHELNFYRTLFDKIVIESEIAFCYFEDGCNQNLLGILGDFLLSLEEVNFVILCAQNNGVINFSLRSEKDELNAASIIRKALDGIGFGGGHSDMAGGVIKDIKDFTEEKIYNIFTDTLRCII